MEGCECDRTLLCITGTPGPTRGGKWAWLRPIHLTSAPPAHPTPLPSTPLRPTPPPPKRDMGTRSAPLNAPPAFQARLSKLRGPHLYLSGKKPRVVRSVEQRQIEIERECKRRYAPRRKSVKGGSQGGAVFRACDSSGAGHSAGPERMRLGSTMGNAGESGERKKHCDASLLPPHACLSSVSFSLAPGSTHHFLRLLHFDLVGERR